MKTTIQEISGKTRVTVQGELDTNSSETFQKNIASLMEKEGVVVELDLGALEYISSKALRIIVSFQQAVVANHGSFCITEVSDSVREVLDMTGLSKSFLELS
ncbi:MAG: STAS domain-containing protein [Bacteroidales bacterium]|nr:STAS domain-containing protein [Bacteroidales bacterium]